jgi:hypothetical protein
MLFSTPVAITANATYVVSYFAPAGRYAVNEGYFSVQGTTNPPLRALSSGTSGGNGLYRYTVSGKRSASTTQRENFICWVHGKSKLQIKRGPGKGAAGDG